MLRKWEHEATVYGYPPNSIPGKFYFLRLFLADKCQIKCTATGLVLWRRLCLINVSGLTNLERWQKPTKQSIIAFGNHKIMFANTLTKTQELDPNATNHKTSTAKIFCNWNQSPSLDHKWSKKLWIIDQLFNHISSTKWLTILILNSYPTTMIK